MAKRAAQKIKSVQGRSNQSRSSALVGNTNARKSFFKTVMAAPATPWVAGGIGLAVIARFAYKYYVNHPEFLETIKENLDTAEEKLKDFSGKIVSSVESDSESEDARH